ncbi:MAG: hypothetical protein MZW92_06180 [Comamonadaceae bacterium]|nr:hypothetical protein [Comamonadaceae bacterium]
MPREFGKYHLIERIATGGMAELYLAKLYGAGGFEKDLAIKKVLPHLAQDQAFVQMFMDEAMITVTLNHGNIVQVIDCGELEGEFFPVMEFIDGVDPQPLIKRGAESYGVTPPRSGCPCTSPSRSCRGLHYAHEKLGPDGRHAARSCTAATSRARRTCCCPTRARSSWWTSASPARPAASAPPRRAWSWGSWPT